MKFSKPGYMLIALNTQNQKVECISEHDTLGEAHAQRRQYVRTGAYQERDLDIWKKDPILDEEGFGDGNYE